MTVIGFIATPSSLDLPAEAREGGELQQAGDGAAMEVARPADDILVERHDDNADPGRLFDAEAQQLGVRRKRFTERVSAARRAGSALRLVSADDAEDEGREQGELHLAGGIVPSRNIPAPQPNRATNMVKAIQTMRTLLTRPDTGPAM